MKRYEVIVSQRAEQVLAIHVGFLARVSLKAAKKLRKEYTEILDTLESNPYQFPVDEDVELPEDYHKTLFSKRYKAVFYVEDNIVFLDAIVDCRMDNANNWTMSESLPSTSD